MSEHDINGPSALARRKECPGSANAESGLPSAPTEASERGNRLHALVAKLITLPEADRLAGIPADLDQDDSAAVTECLAVFRDVMDEAAGYNSPHKRLLLIEHKVDLSPLGILVPGTVDLAVVIPGEAAWLLDWKFGRMWVPAGPWNIQLQAYAWGIAEAFGVRDIRAAIVQPARGTEMRVATWDAEALATHANTIRSIVAATKDPNAPMVAGEWCDMCRRRPTCPKRAELTAVTAQITDPVAVMGSTAPQERAALWDRLKLAAKVLSDASDRIEEAALTGALVIPGYKIGEGRKTREWADAAVAEVALKRLAAGKGMPEDSVFERKMLSPAGAEKLLGKSKAMAEQLASLIEEKAGAQRLVRDRQAIA